MNIYTEIILDHYQNPRNFGEIKNPTLVSEASNSVCGDKLKIFILVEDKKIKDIKFFGTGCAISIASASFITSYLKGKSISQLKKINKDFIIKMLGINLGVNRIKCAVLVGEAISKLKV
ncbi:MAG: SUF system NifU family Fe-S cluster assembly protein [Patescibacteria group bacterium]|nr:SUF system NifU family Fe-S cluster assembly protein [Patescibacteria group bacterium]